PQCGGSAKGAGSVGRRGAARYHSADFARCVGGRSESRRTRGSNQRVTRDGGEGTSGIGRSLALCVARPHAQGSQHVYSPAERGGDSRSRAAAKVLKWRGRCLLPGPCASSGNTSANPRVYLSLAT